MKDITVKVWGVAPDGTELISGKDAQAIITLLSSEIQAITKHNHALAAQVESHSDALKALLKTVPWFGVDGSLQADGQFYYKVAESVFKKAESALAKAPQQCLAELRAEAGRAGFIEAYKIRGEIMHAAHSGEYEALNRFANQYAESIRQSAARW